eukprot:scaffold254_cov124-Skeletonema_marinoi.AAC.1
MEIVRDSFAEDAGAEDESFLPADAPLAAAAWGGSLDASTGRVMSAKSITMTSSPVNLEESLTQ